jgi:hypothetical protein
MVIVKGYNRKPLEISAPTPPSYKEQRTKFKKGVLDRRNIMQIYLCYLNNN